MFRLIYIIEFVCLLVSIPVLYMIPLGYIESRSFCVFYNMIGAKCGGCGLTRAFFNLLHLNITEAIDYNILIVIFFPLIVYCLYKELYSIYHIVINRDRDCSFLVGVMCKILDLQ